MTRLNGSKRREPLFEVKAYEGYRKVKLSYNTVAYVTDEYDYVFSKLINMLPAEARVRTISEKTKKEAEFGVIRLGQVRLSEEKEGLIIVEIPKYIGSPNSIFTVAHEVAHVLLGHLYDDSGISKEWKRKQEVEANRWAYRFFKKNFLRITPTIEENQEFVFVPNLERRREQSEEK